MDETKIELDYSTRNSLGNIADALKDVARALEKIADKIGNK